MNRAKMRFFTLVFLACFAAATTVAQEADDEFDMDSLFGDEMVEEIPSGQEGGAPNADPLASLLTSQGTRIGGSFSGSLDSAFTWEDLWTGGTSFFDPEKKNLSLSLASMLYFDARPSEDFRAYGSVKAGFFFAAKADDPTAAAINVPNIKIFRTLFDFNLDDKIFSAGKTVKWGVRYFWSADVISLESINILDASPTRGTYKFRAHLPILGTQNSFYFYTILNSDDIKYRNDCWPLKRNSSSAAELGLEHTTATIPLSGPCSPSPHPGRLRRIRRGYGFQGKREDLCDTGVAIPDIVNTQRSQRKLLFLSKRGLQVQ